MHIRDRVKSISYIPFKQCTFPVLMLQSTCNESQLIYPSQKVQQVFQNREKHLMTVFVE